MNEIGAIPLKDWVEFIQSITMEEDELRDFCEVDNFDELKFQWKIVT